MKGSKRIAQYGLDPLTVAKWLRGSGMALIGTGAGMRIAPQREVAARNLENSRKRLASPAKLAALAAKWSA